MCLTHGLKRDKKSFCRSRVDYGIKFCVKYIYELSDFVGGRKIVKQGCRLTLYLFNIFVANFIYCIGV